MELSKEMEYLYIYHMIVMVTVLFPQKNYEKYWRKTKVHRLVAIAFCDGRSEERNEVNHIDYNRTNNYYKNLEWVTHRENVQHSKSHYIPKYGKDNPNYGNHSLSQKYKLNQELCKQKQSRPGLQNGRCRKIDLYCNGAFVETFDYISLCCQYFIDNKISNSNNIESVRNRINQSVRTHKPYKGYTFIKH